MDIHEYQAKELLNEFGVQIPVGGLAYSPEQAVYRAQEIGGEQWVVKAQIHSGARGKAGGIRVCHSDQEIWQAADDLLGKRLTTEQTDKSGKVIQRLYIERGADIDRELYVGFVLDRSYERIMVVASANGGSEIEEIAHSKPGSLIRTVIEPAVGMQAFQAREIAFALDIPAELISQAVKTLLGAYRAFRDLDATMVEINPLVITHDNQLIAVDVKMSFDDNALYRRGAIAELRDKSQENSREQEAADRGLAYVGLDGEIGCMINGAGLAMATMDMIQHAGGRPANFMDIGGGASPERVAKAIRLILSDPNVETLLVNIFAGINRCDWVAQGVVDALERLQPEVPVVVRLSGTNEALGNDILKRAKFPVIATNSLADAAAAAVAQWQQRQVT